MCLFFICSCLFLVIIFLQLIIIDSFLDGQFYDLGFQVLSLPTKSQNTSETISQIFPRKIVCDINYVTKTGTKGNSSYSDLFLFLQ